jgi:hypothetical protein
MLLKTTACSSIFKQNIILYDKFLQQSATYSSGTAIYDKQGKTS